MTEEQFERLLMVVSVSWSVCSELEEEGKVAKVNSWSKEMTRIEGLKDALIVMDATDEMLDDMHFLWSIAMERM